MNILMILYKDFPPDIRVEKEIKSLAEEGHKIYVLAKHQKANIVKKKIKNATVIYAPSKNIIEKISSNINRTNRSLIRIIKNLINEYDINAIHVHDSPLLKNAYMATKGNRDIKLIADLHENMPAALKCYKEQADQNNYSFLRSLKYRLFNNYAKYIKYEKKYLSYFDKVIFVAKEAKERFENNSNILEKSLVVSNYVDISKFENRTLDEKVIDNYKGDFVISYIGGFGIHRGIDTTIKAMEHLKDYNIKLLLIGAKGFYAKRMKDLINELDLNQYIELIEWVEFEKIFSYNYISDITLVPHNMYEHTDTTVPHKLFQYMYMKKPVIVSSCRPLKRIVEETKSGLWFEAGNENDLAAKILKLYNDRNLIKELGKNGHYHTEKKYNWKNGSKKLIKMYEDLEL